MWAFLMRKATTNFAMSSQIVVGGFGTVYKGRLSNGTTVAIKRSKREGLQQDKQQFLNEVRILSQLNHRHLVKLLGCCLENKIAVLVFEYVPNGDLLERLQRKDGKVGLSWRQRLLIATQTADALAYLHSSANPPIYHRDIKSANILLDEHLDAKVADFGISRFAPLGATHVSTVVLQGTIGYIDPENTSLHVTDKSDVYSFGVVLLELISAQSVVDFRRGYEDAGLVSFAVPLINTGDFQRLLDPVLVETFNSETGKDSIVRTGRLAVSCLARRSKNRPTMKQVWKELQTLLSLLQADAISDYIVGCNELEISESGDYNSQDCIPLFSDSSFSGPGIRTDDTGNQIQMADLTVSDLHVCHSGARI